MKVTTDVLGEEDDRVALEAPGLMSTHGHCLK